MTNIAALDADGLHYDLVKPVNWPSIVTAAPLFVAMRRAAIDILYVHASALDKLGLPAELDIPLKGQSRPPHPFVAGALFEGRSLSTSRLGPCIEADGMEILIGAYQDGAGDPFSEAANGAELLAAHARFARALGSGKASRPWYFRQSAMQTGWKLMHSAWAYGVRANRLRGLDFDANPRPVLDGVNDGAQIEVPFGSWASPPDIPGVELPVVSAWDVNGQRLSACSRLPVGVSGLEDRDGDSFDPKLPGYHLVRKVNNPFGAYLPPIFEPGWHTTPRVAMAEYLGLDVSIDRSHVWTQSVAYLDPWYDRLRAARERLIHEADERGGALALDALKQCYLQPLGRLRSMRAREKGDKYFRPHWYDAVIGQELAREYMRLYALARSEGQIRVLAIYFDTIIIEAATADPPDELPVSDQLGKYKLVGTMPTSEARAILYDGEGANVGALVKALKNHEPGNKPGSTPGEAARPWNIARPAHGGYPGVVPSYA